MTKIKLFLFIITLWVLWGLKENMAIWPQSFQSNSLVIWFLSATSTSIYLVLLVIGILLLRLYKTYYAQHFFDAKSSKLVTLIAYCVFFLAILDSTNRALSDYFANPTWRIDWVFTNYFWRIIFNSPALLFCSLLLFLLADFMKKAIMVKTENESFI